MEWVKLEQTFLLHKLIVLVKKEIIRYKNFIIYTFSIVFYSLVVNYMKKVSHTFHRLIIFGNEERNEHLNI